MAVTLNASNIHLYSVAGNGFTSSLSPCSITVWINANWNAATTISMVGMYDGSTTVTPVSGIQIGTRTGAGEVSVWKYGGTVLVQSALAAMTPYSNVWTNVAYTFDGTTHSVYNNGVLLATGTTAQTSTTYTQVWINGYPPTGNANETATFSVDSYQYFNRALTSDEVLSIYNCFGSRHGDMYGTVARYEFDELADGTTTSSVTDLSGNGNGLAVSGTGTAIVYSYTTSFPDSNIRSPL